MLLFLYSLIDEDQTLRSHSTKFRELHALILKRRQATPTTLIVMVSLAWDSYYLGGVEMNSHINDQTLGIGCLRLTWGWGVRTRNL